MRLNDLVAADDARPRVWDDSDATVFVSVDDCPTISDALAAYKREIGEEWIHEVTRELTLCCDHEPNGAPRNDACPDAIEQDVWVFAP